MPIDQLFVLKDIVHSYIVFSFMVHYLKPFLAVASFVLLTVRAKLVSHLLFPVTQNHKLVVEVFEVSLGLVLRFFLILSSSGTDRSSSSNEELILFSFHDSCF